MIITRKTTYSYSRETQITYSIFVLAPRIGLDSIYYTYKDMKKNEYYNFISSRGSEEKTILKPKSFEFIKARDLREFKSFFKKSSWDKSIPEWTVLDGEPEEYGLYIPKPFKRGEIKFETEYSRDMTKEMVDEIEKRLGTVPTVIIGEDLTKAHAPANYSTNNNQMYELACPKCQKMFYPEDDKYPNFTCPHCKSTAHTIVTKEFKNYRSNEYDTDSWGSSKINYSTADKEKFFYLKPSEDGMTLFVISREATSLKGKIVTRYNVEYRLNHFVGKDISCVKYLKKSERPADPFEALNINTKNINYFGHIIYEGAEDFSDFALINEKFLRMSGFQSALKYSPMKLKLEPFFIVFLAVLNKYPILEQIIKMGHARLFFGLYQSMLHSMNKAEITEQVEKMNELVNNEATKGKEALRFPPYIGDYLIKKNSSISEYFYWRDIFEITGMTKEQFENFTESFSYAWVSSQAGLEDVCNILKFDYPIEKLFTYILKQSKKYKLSVDRVVLNLTDYLNMCDLADVTPDKYPQDVKKQHDDMLSYFKRKEKLEYDKKLTLIGVECEKYVVPKEEELDAVGIPKLFKEYTVVFPRCDQDFIDEGNQQHNCVGSYPRNVRNGNCVIFFIRKKETPYKSFITAECTRSGLGQCFYSNNRTVNDEDLIKFARYIANKIKTGVSSGKIHALNNI